MVYWLFVTICISIIFPSNASAYIDPGTGSFIVQMLIASILGAVFTIKLWYGAAKRFVSGIFSKKNNSETQSPKR